MLPIVIPKTVEDSLRNPRKNPWAEVFNNIVPKRDYKPINVIHMNDPTFPPLDDEYCVCWWFISPRNMFEGVDIIQDEISEILLIFHYWFRYLGSINQRSRCERSFILVKKL